MSEAEATSNRHTYRAIPRNSKQTRVLNTQKVDNRDDPIVCNLSKVDLDDRTITYNEALEVFSGALIPILSRFRKGLTRRVFWNYWNLDPGKARASWDTKTAHDVAAQEPLHDFCDRPLVTGCLGGSIGGIILPSAIFKANRKSKKQSHLTTPPLWLTRTCMM
jgi:hypothetical protein